MAKPIKTFETIDAARRQFALKSLEELGAMKSTEVRQAAIDCDIRYIDRAGETVRISNARKDELVAEIFKVCTEKRLIANVQTALTSEQLAEIEGIAVATDEVTENQDGSIASEIYQELRGYTRERWDADTQRFLATNGELNRLVLRLVTRLRADNQAISTTLNRKRAIINAMLKMLEVDRNETHYNQYRETFNEFQRNLNATLRDLSEEKNRLQGKRLADRGRNVCEVKVSRLYDWAVDTLVNLKETDSPAKWRDVAIALMLTTGRRQSEILSSAQFTESGSDDSVMFSGQLKTKGRSDAPEVYEIPVFAPASAVINGLNWLTSKNKRHPDPAVAHNRFSKELSGRMVVPGQYYEIDFKPESVGGKEPKGSKLTSHLCRQIYAQKLKPMTPKGTQPRRYLASALGHSPDDINTVESYDADIIVLDA
jgi:hypothetical protein